MFSKSLLPMSLFVHMLVACSGSSSGNNSAGEVSPDLDGTWQSGCQEVDNSQSLLESAHFYRQLRVDGNSIEAMYFVFSDSDCVTVLDLPFEAEGFSQGTFILGQAFTTGSGLTAHPISIETMLGDESLLVNIVTRVNNSLFFGFDPLIGANSANTELPTEVNLDDGFRLLTESPL